MTDEQLEGRFVELLQNAVEKVKTEEDPVALNRLRKLFKKHVPFALRMYVAAYFVKKAAEGGNHRDSYRNKRDSERQFNNRKRFAAEENATAETASEPAARRNNRAERTAEGRPEREATPRVTIPQDKAQMLFISIGRNRRAYPRDFISMIVQNTEVPRERIGDIRVLDNYSFVQLYAEDCAGVIEALNGFEYRGRKLSVSYARKKEETAADADTIPADADNTTYANHETAVTDDYAAAQKAFAENAMEDSGNSSEYLV
ncbi:MAG: DbpA RNA binding domain-containing protein [Treponemataceae bacterium]|nr:DbpA RNA binding domain-containing protein [Treponemataceae bacterium]